MPIEERIGNIVKNNFFALFMKGPIAAPFCINGQ